MGYKTLYPVMLEREGKPKAKHLPLKGGKVSPTISWKREPRFLNASGQKGKKRPGDRLAARAGGKGARGTDSAHVLFFA